VGSNQFLHMLGPSSSVDERPLQPSVNTILPIASSANNTPPPAEPTPVTEGPYAVDSGKLKRAHSINRKE